MKNLLFLKYLALLILLMCSYIPSLALKDFPGVIRMSIKRMDKVVFLKFRFLKLDPHFRINFVL